EQKRQETVFFVCLGSGANAPFWQLKVVKAFRRNRQTDLTFTLVKSSKLLYFDAVYPERKYGREDINKETGEIQN
ncbi:hypothetical protein ACI3PK_11895, partial [Lactococcus cremoris]